jgi:hypothetical protein
MAGSFVNFVESLIYGTGLAPNPNHRDWLALGLVGGTDWLTHYLDRMLAAYEAWVAAEGLPPVTPWDGVRPQPWNPALTVALGPDLDGSFIGIGNLDQLGTALRTRYTAVAGLAQELNGVLKAPFSYRFWGYLKWSWQMRERFLGRQVFPTGVIIDRDGTILSAVEFLDTFNDTHRSWHGAGGAPVAPTPFLRTTAGQRSSRGILGAGLDGEDFLRFHRENQEIFHRWYARTEQPPLVPIDMGRPGGWPPTAPGTVNPPDPWVFDEAVVITGSPFAGNTSPNQIGGDIEFAYHVAGHGNNTDIGPLSHNNYVPRFQNWHGWIDAQWWWREPRFSQSNPTTGERTRVFRPVLQDGSEFPGVHALSIVRDPAAPGDTLYPANAVAGLDFTTGAGTLRFKLYVRDPLGHDLRMRLRAEVLDAAGAVASTVTILRDIGPAGDHPLDTEFTEDIAFADAFVSDDPARANPAVGFVNSRIRVTGNLWVPNLATPDDPTTSPDAGFVHEDIAYIDLVREKLAPETLIYQNLSTFSEDQVTSNMSGSESRFDNAFYAVTQDRTSLSYPMPVWPAAVADEVKGLILDRIPASGLYDDVAHAPEVVLWQESVDAPFNGVTVELQGPPAKEDPSLPPEIPQRLTWTYSVIFNHVNDAFSGLAPGASRNGRLRVTTRDRAGNASTVQEFVKFLRAANPYMIDGPTPWLSVDTRVFTVLENQTRFQETMTPGRDPLDYLNAVTTRLNNGTSGADTFDSLPAEGPGAALEYAQSIPNPSTGASTPIFNFALAKVRLQASGGAVGVRAFFRAFRYAAPSLLFDTTKGYRFHDNGSGKIVPVLGFESETNGAALLSVPFFASPRVDPTVSSLEAQTDPNNVHDFPAGPAGERVWYFGAWLDINQPSTRLPVSFSSASVNGNGPYPVASLQSLRTLMDDFHQCMVTEIRYDLDPTDPLASPTNSDNLAQRNLTILASDNPGDPITRTVEHSFEVDLARPRKVDVPVPQAGPSATHAEHDHPGAPRHGGQCPVCGHDGHAADNCCECCGNLGEHGPFEPGTPHGKVSAFVFERLMHEEAMNIAFQTPGAMRLMLEPDGHHKIVEKFGAQAAAVVRRSFPVIFHPARWQQTARVMDELMIVWNDLPRASQVRLFLPGMDVEELTSLRNARHAPPTVTAAGNSVLRLDVADVTYIPIPPMDGNRQAAVLTIELPEGVKAGQRFIVDIIQLRAGAQVSNGAFRVEINIQRAAQIVAAVQRGVVLLQERLSLLPRKDRRIPVLARRLETERRRAAALSARAGVPWDDPTQWTGPDGTVHPVTGMKIRVVIEKIQIVDDQDPWWKGAGEIDFSVRVRTENNGGVERTTRLPENGHYRLRSGESITLNRLVFEGFAVDHLAIRIDAMERDKFSPDDSLGAYTRVFGCAADAWFDTYGPFDEALDPERVGPWQLWYRIERG